MTSNLASTSPQRLLVGKVPRSIRSTAEALLDVDASGQIVPSQYAKDIKSTGFDIITWSFERADLRTGAANAGFYYYFDPNSRALKKDSSSVVIHHESPMRAMLLLWHADPQRIAE